MKKILVIDDDDTFRSFVCRLLTKNSYVVSEAEDGLKGVSKFLEESPDLVVTDIIMPVQDGLETIVQLRKAGNSIPIIALSGGGRLDAESYLPLAEGLGAVRTIAKPFGNNEFLQTVAECLNKDLEEKGGTCLEEKR